MPAVQLPGESLPIINVRDGCGRGWHLNRWGRCVPNRWQARPHYRYGWGRPHWEHQWRPYREHRWHRPQYRDGWHRKHRDDRRYWRD
ncbi:GCG_CRPN prefix-to-repeats domain-containing protein [Pseudaminobacter salicylatoxidans]|uniref:GCG_CRPN prefix-to-repeats domain-containing protein n=1 Tax=Pseudaminobacter salicylatoxidans TaxID=93369 RepID=UPI003CC74F32